LTLNATKRNYEYLLLAAAFQRIVRESSAGGTERGYEGSRVGADE